MYKIFFECITYLRTSRLKQTVLLIVSNIFSSFLNSYFLFVSGLKKLEIELRDLLDETNEIKHALDQRRKNSKAKSHRKAVIHLSMLSLLHA